ncbi:MAG: SCO family protein [Vicinamibacteria bacterium]
MSPVLPLPDPIAPAAPPVLFGALLGLTFFLHLLPMNLLLGGSLVLVHLRLSRRADDAADRALLARTIARARPVLMAATVTLGVAPLLFLQALHGRVFFTSSILMAWAWLAIVPLAMAAYYGAYAAASDAPPRPWLDVAVAALLLAVAFVQTTNATRSLRLETFAAAHRLDPRGLLLNLDDPTFWPRYLHVVLGAVAVAGLGIALLGRRWRAEDPGRGARTARRGLSIFALATAANVFVGLALLIALPKAVLIRLVGGGGRGSVLVLSVGLLLAVALAGAALLALGARRPERAAMVVGALLLATLAAMVVLREEVRRVTFANAALDPLPAAAPQWGAFALFLLFLAAGVAAIGWMVRALASARGAAVLLLALAALGGGGCRPEPARPAAGAPARHALHGRVVSVEKARRAVTIAHDDIPGFMPAMTMEFVVRERDAALLERVGAGDEITATLVVPDSRYWIEELVVVKRGVGAAPSAPPKGALPGDALPDVALVDQDGRDFRLSSLRGRAYAVTFVFTRCPMPEYCPLLMKRFAAAEAALVADPGLREKTRLLTVSFDTKHDRPAVLKAFGRPFQLTSPPFTHWRLATGTDEAVRTLGTALELDYEEDTGQFVHNLRTAVVGRDGKLARLLRGNEWTAEELVAALREAAGL